MSASPPARVRPTLLAWARTSANLTIEALAKRTKLAAHELDAWERGEGLPSVEQLRAIAKACRRPLVVFYLPEPPRDFDAMRDYRRVSGVAPAQSPNLTAEVRRAHELREAALELAERIGEPPIPARFAAKIADNPEVAARRARERLGISVDAVAAWTDAHEALRSWRSALEQQGVLTVQTTGVRVGEVRGFTLHERPFPVVAVNGTDAAYGRIFSLMHELGHLALGHDARCRIDPDDEGADRKGRVERFCNAFAGALLMPAESVLAHPAVRPTRAARRWGDDELEALSRTFRVSRDAALRRLLDLGRTPPDFYRETHARYAGETAARSGGGDFYRTRVARLGRSFIRLVLTGLAEGHISRIDAAVYLGVKTPQLARLQNAAFDGSAA
jgi:Zn-dependent peptidase ImmA (M78 family)/transcriptional regulator with XRE-family HTH domain